jgi:hypothetical protein
VGKRYFLRIACVLLLLLAQQGALTHGIWHLGNFSVGNLHSAQDDDLRGSRPNDPSPQSGLCDFHFALGALLAVGGPGEMAIPAIRPVLTRETFPERFRHSPSRLTPFSRAPPVFL